MELDTEPVANLIPLLAWAAKKLGVGEGTCDRTLLLHT